MLRSPGYATEGAMHDSGGRGPGPLVAAFTIILMRNDRVPTRWRAYVGVPIMPSFMPAHVGPWHALAIRGKLACCKQAGLASPWLG